MICEKLTESKLKFKKNQKSWRKNNESTEA